jgi:hypothetical protein
MRTRLRCIDTKGIEMAPVTPHQKKSTGLLLGGSIVALLGGIFLALGGTGIWAETQRDSNGYFSTHSHSYRSNTRAIESDGIRVGSGVPTWFAGNVRLDVSGAKGTFVGIARKATVDAYLASVAHAEATDLDLDPFKVTYVARAGSAHPGRPGDQPFWEAASTGTGTLDWKLRPGRWSIVVMNTDGSSNVSAAIAAGVKVPGLLWASIGFAAFGSALLAGAVLMFRSRERSYRHTTTAAPAPA